MKRSRSPSPPLVAITKKEEHTCQAQQWATLHDRSILLLPPTPGMVSRAALAASTTSTSLPVMVAAFDLDDALIMPVSGAVFAKDDPNDWKFIHPNVPRYLKLLYEAGFLIVVLSNQSKVCQRGWNAAKAEALQEKVVRVAKAAEIQCVALMATKDDVWRKPSVALWSAVQDCVESAAGVAATQKCVEMRSFYVGDAAGRSIRTLAGRAKDFACTDRQFAYNLRIPFLTPEEWFLTSWPKLLSPASTEGSTTDVREGLLSDVRKKAETPEALFSWGEVGPDMLSALPTSYAGLRVRRLTATAVNEVELHPCGAQGAPNLARAGVQEMILLVGPPSSGKTTFYRRCFQPFGYLHINRDTLKSKDKCLALATDLWKAGRSFVVDNTNPSVADRQQYLDIIRRCRGGASHEKLPVRVFVFMHAKGYANHLNHVRARSGISSKIPIIAMHSFYSKLEPYTMEMVAKEGIEEVVEIPPVAMFDGLPPQVKREFYRLG